MIRVTANETRPLNSVGLHHQHSAAVFKQNSECSFKPIAKAPAQTKQTFSFKKYYVRCLTESASIYLGSLVVGSHVVGSIQCVFSAVNALSLKCIQ